MTGRISTLWLGRRGSARYGDLVQLGELGASETTGLLPDFFRESEGVVLQILQSGAARRAPEVRSLGESGVFGTRAQCHDPRHLRDTACVASDQIRVQQLRIHNVIHIEPDAGELLHLCVQSVVALPGPARLDHLQGIQFEDQRENPRLDGILLWI